MLSSTLPSPADLIETFALLEDWESRYAYLIDLGRALPSMDPALQTDDILVKGCTSRVWLVVEKQNSPLTLREREGARVSGKGEGKKNDVYSPSPGSFHSPPSPSRGEGGSVFHFTIDSDAAIVKGLCAVLMVFVQDRTADEIRAVDMQDVFTRLGLGTHLSPNRRNGFFAMVERVKVLVG